MLVGDAFITSGDNVQLASAGPDFANAVVDLLQDADKRHKMAAAARQLVEENYSAETVARQFEAICIQAVDSQKTAAGTV